MSEHIVKSHNKSLLLYHLVCPAKYRRKVFSDEVEQTLKETCKGIEERYEIFFLEIGVDNDHVHFLIQGIPILAPYRLVQIIKAITSKEIQRLHPEVKELLWGGAIWTSGYYINTVGQYGNEDVIKKYVQSQGREKEYKKIHSSQLKLF
jgi:REP element-mobilizing transposase RayT